MPVIQVLSPTIANQIAAGEVVERPSSVVKELVENAIDAGSSGITIEIENGGLDSIRVTDNGCGIPGNQVATAFLRHATSKITKAEDLFHIDSLGFRGEALASIAAVSTVTMKTCTASEEMGTWIVIEDGKVLSTESIGCPVGTMVEVKNLFASVPARYKFLKNNRTEAGYVSDYISRMMMARPDIAFTFRNNGKNVYQTFGDGELLSVLVSIYGTGIKAHLAEVFYDDGYIKISGYVGDADLSKPNRSQQTFFINGRYIRSSSLSMAVSNAFETRLMIGRFPFNVLRIMLAPSDVDVNVHPTKMEARFSDENRVAAAVRKACTSALQKGTMTYREAEQKQWFNKADIDEHTQLHVSVPGYAVPVKSDKIDNPFFDKKQESFDISNTYSVNESSGLDPYIPNIFGKDPESINDNRELDVSNVTEYMIPIAGKNCTEKEKKVHIEQPRLADTPYTIVGCLFDAYWIIQQDEDIYFIDQHAAHERRNYEELMSGHETYVSQELLIPRELTLEPDAYRILRERIKEITDIGYKIDFCNGYTVAIHAVPQIKGIILDDSFLFDALYQLEILGQTSDKQLIKSILIQSSCKHAIKAGEKIGKEEIEKLLTFFKQKGAPMTCPHGRPVMVRMTRRELEKLFKRIV